MNLQECSIKALKLINEYTNNGILISPQKNADYTTRVNHFADMAQKELSEARKLPATYVVTQNPIPNILGEYSGFDIVQHKTNDIILEGNAKSYYFEVDNIADVYIEENVNGVWSALETIHNTSKKIFTAYKNLINSINPVRIRFSGEYFYNIRNTALYEANFPSKDDIPDYTPYVRYQLPDDYMEFKSVINETDGRKYEQIQQYYFENRKTLLLDYYYKGQFIVNYYKFPKDIDDSTQNTYEFEVDIDVQECIPFFVAGHLILDENPTVAVQLLNEYQLKLSRIGTNDTYSATTIENVYFM